MSLGVLLVEDNPVDELTVRAMLSHGLSDARVDACPTLSDAVALVGGGLRPDVALLDLHLPDAEGTEIITVVRDALPTAAVVVLTGASDDMGRPCIEVGAHQYLPKRELQADRLWRTVEAAQATARIQHDLAAALDDRDRVVGDMEELMSIVAHDLRAPLRTARLYADRLTADPARRAVWGGRLDDSLGRMDEMVRALLDYGELGRAIPAPADLELAEIGSDVCDDLLHDLEQVGGVLTWSASGRVWCDPVMLRQVIENLVLNSIRYRHPDRAPVIEVAAEDLRGGVAITVTDNGVGIEPQFWDRIFRPFERLTSEGEGLGLGLAAARRLLHANGGDLHVAHSDHDGTTMRVLARAA